MSNKFTGITSAGSAIPVYDKDAHEALSSKLETSAFSSVSGEFATVDDVVAAVSGKADTTAIPSLDGYATQEWVGEQGYLTEVPESAVSGFATHEEVESATSGLQPSGDYATNSAVAAALSGKADTTALNNYLTKASGDEFYVKNTPYEVTAGPTDGSGGNPVFRANPGGLYVGGAGFKVLSATPDHFNAGDPDRGLILSADSNKFIYSGANKTIISADTGSFAFNSQYHSFNVNPEEINFSGVRANLDVTSAIIFSSTNPNIGSAALTTAQYNTIVQTPSPKFEAKNISGAGFSIEASAAKGYDHNGNVVWDTSNPPAPNNLVGYGDTKASTGGLNSNIILTYFGKAATGNPLTSAPYTILDCNGLSATYGSTAGAPYTVISPNGITARYSGNSAAAALDFNDIKFTRGSATWSLTGSVQKSEIACDSATSAITAIAGSAIGGGGGSTYSAGANIDITDNVISGKDWTDDIVSATSGLQPSGDYYSATNPSGFMTELPASATEAIDTVTANSGTWGGSALPISAGPGIKVDLVDNTLVFSNDETVLFETDSPSGVSAVTCSETVKNFERIAVLPSRFATTLNGGTGPYQYYETKWLTTGADTENTIEPMVFEYLFWKIAKYSANNDFTEFVWNGGFEVQQDTQTYRDLSTCNVGIKKIIGINRISGGN